ncbi:MAG: efflux RND transporter periplasmic adaptor subunit [Pseudomonadales bacterium]|nr:efflux RND transporter periplasmic adaptor subunit [Pseudomonadales bacterium]
MIPRKKLWLTGASLGLLLLMIVVFWPSPLPVETGTAERRILTETVEAQGRTRARNPFMITAPLSGKLWRPLLEEGDTVSKGQAIASISLAVENGRARAIYQTEVTAAQARHAAAQASVTAARSAFERAKQEQARRDALFTNQSIGVEERDYYQQLTAAAQARLLNAQALLEAALAEVNSAQARLLGLVPGTGDVVEQIFSPVNGTVYRVFERDERVVVAGTVLMSISNNDQLEIVIDLLTQDAVRVEPGQPIVITGWGGDDQLHGSVRHVEPEAFTKISALGVEEQRVHVIGDLLDTPAGLGAAYRIDAAIVVWEQADILSIPASAVFQQAGLWQTFVVDAGVANLRQLEIGHHGHEYVQVLSGIDENERVILYPSAQVQDKTRVSSRYVLR